MRRRRRRKSLIPAFVTRALAGLLLLGLALVEGVHDLRRQTWPGFTESADLIGLVLVPIFLVGAIAAFLPRRAAWWWSAGAGGVALLHGLFLRLGDSRMGMAFVGCGLLVLSLLALSSVLLTTAALRRARGQRTRAAHPASTTRAAASTSPLPLEA